MAAKRTRKKSQRRTKAQIAAQNQILAVLLCTIGLLFFFLAFVKGSEGWLSAHNVLLGIFGWSAFFIGPILIYISAVSYTHRDVYKRQNTARCTTRRAERSDTAMWWS